MKLLLLALLPFAGAALLGVVPNERRRAAGWVAGVVTLAALALVLAAAPEIFRGQVLRWSTDWPPTLGLTFGFRAGDKVVDASGNVVALSNGVKIRPASCREDDCVVTYDGSSSLQMDQMVATFTLLQDLMWSDGKPLTTADSLYSYQLAADANTPVSKYVIDRTASYEAADEYTIQWWGLPGYIDPDYYTNFWMPLPQHAWSESGPADLLRLEASSRLPIGWGPYILDEWKEGDSIHLVKNLNYFLAPGGLPKFDELTFQRSSIHPLNSQKPPLYWQPTRDFTMASWRPAWSGVWPADKPASFCSF